MLLRHWIEIQKLMKNIFVVLLFNNILTAFSFDLAYL
jgi:hypothetical protein